MYFEVRVVMMWKVHTIVGTHGIHISLNVFQEFQPKPSTELYSFPGFWNFQTFNSVVHVVICTSRPIFTPHESNRPVYWDRAFHLPQICKSFSFSPALCTHPQHQRSPCKPKPHFPVLFFCNQMKSVPNANFQVKLYWSQHGCTSFWYVLPSLK